MFTLTEVRGWKCTGGCTFQQIVIVTYYYNEMV